MNSHWEVKKEVKEINETIRYYVNELGHNDFTIDDYLKGFTMYLIDSLNYIPSNYGVIPFIDMHGTGIDIILKNDITKNMICVEILCDLTIHASIFKQDVQFNPIFENDVEISRINDLIDEYIK